MSVPSFIHNCCPGGVFSSLTMPTKWSLVAMNDVAKSFTGPDGSGPNITLKDSMKFGRSVPRSEGCRLPMEWQQISGQHCRIFIDKADGLWYLEDMSTNGTYVNGKKIPKNKVLHLNSGDRIRLSTETLHGPPVPEYSFMMVEDEGADGTGIKRRQDLQEEGQGSGSALKRMRYSLGTGGASKVDPSVNQVEGTETSMLKSLTQFQKTNADLRSKLETARAAHAEAEKKLRGTESQLSLVTSEKEDLERESLSKEEKSASKCTSLANELSALKTKLANAETQISGMLDAQRNLEKSSSEWKEMYEKTLSRCENLQQDVEIATKEKECAKEALTGSRTRLNEALAKSRQDTQEKDKLLEEKQIILKDLEYQKQENINLKDEQAQAKKESEETKLKLGAMMISHAKLQQMNRTLEEESEDNKRMCELAAEELKEYRDKTELQQARIRNMASFAMGLSSTALDMNQLAKELMSRFDGALSGGKSPDPCISETECALDHDPSRAPQEKEQSLTPYPNAKKGSKELLADGSQNLDPINEDRPGGLADEKAVKSPHLRPAKQELPGVKHDGSNGVRNQEKSPDHIRHHTARAQGLDDAEFPQAKQTSRVSNGLKLPKTLDVEENEDTAFPEVAESSLPDSCDEQPAAPAEDDLAGSTMPVSLRSQHPYPPSNPKLPTETEFNEPQMDPNVEIPGLDMCGGVSTKVKGRGGGTSEMLLDNTQASGVGSLPLEPQEMNPYDLYVGLDDGLNEMDTSQ